MSARKLKCVAVKRNAMLTSANVPARLPASTVDETRNTVKNELIAPYKKEMNRQPKISNDNKKGR
ncbi:predicted protein [Coccidioides posadasii str. Silveira]|uniref:Predicted protein n=1 Tax=Coccidioides posadasii (strain RMSCC 757 / Silveira) TaxID=443226 RepID=E9DJV8_COCPS|nr:predicted protein [Coccidioides posadasii str. Silveira]